MSLVTVRTETSVDCDSPITLVKYVLEDVSSTVFFFFQAEDGIRDLTVTGVQTCALPISESMSGVSIQMRPPGTSQSLMRRTIRTGSLKCSITCCRVTTSNDCKGN